MNLKNKLLPSLAIQRVAIVHTLEAGRSPDIITKRSVILMSMLSKLQPVTLAEFEALEKQEGLTYELIDSVVMMSPRPAIKHQRINGKLHAALLPLLTSKHCEPILEADLIIEEQNFVPDLMVVCGDNLDDMPHYDKPPLIVIEIVSPSSVSRDYFVKRRAYNEIGAQEYWIVSPEEKCIMVICFATGEECRYCEGSAKSFIMPEIAIDLGNIFA